MEFCGKGFSIQVNIPDQDALEFALKDRFQAGKGFALATLNVDHLVKLARNRDFAQAYESHDLICADGNPIVWMAKLGGNNLSLVPGSDQVIPMVQWATDCNVSIALVGSTPDALEKSAAHLTQAVSGVKIAKTISPPFGFDPKGRLASEILDDVKASGAGLCLLALGAPKQELFAAFGHQRYPEIGFASIGAGLDFLAGHQARAPKWVRQIAMEWLWRMLSNPKRLLKRYAECAIVLPGHTGSAIRQRINSKPKP